MPVQPDGAAEEVCSCYHRTLFFSPHNRIIRFRKHGQTGCCVIFLDTGTFSSDCYLCILEQAINPMYIFEKEFTMIIANDFVFCPAIQHWVLTNISFFSITLTFIMSCPLRLYSSFVFYLYSWLNKFAFQFSRN